MANLSPISESPSSTHSFAPIAAPTLPTISNKNTTTTKTKSKPRKRVNTAEKRSQHNAIERARRETLNGKFLSLARLLPSLANSRRPSKSAIVNGSISHLTHQRDQRLLAAKLLKDLLGERDELLKEVNDWRKLNGFTPKDAGHEYTDEMEQINSVQNESFGDFSAMGGDNDDQDDEESLESQDAVMNNNMNFSQVNGLITPRSSTDIDAAFQPQMFTLPSAPVGQTPPVQQHPATATAGVGINWSTEFAFNLNQQMNVSNFGSGGDSLSMSSSSPPQNIVSPTSETATVPAMYQHTPSPGSSPESISQVAANVNVNVGANVMPGGWNAQSLAMLQQHAIQHNTLMRQHQHQHQHQHQQQQQQQQIPTPPQTQQAPAPAPLFNPIVGNSFNAMFNSSAPAGLAASPTSAEEFFTQNMLHTMFPQRNNNPTAQDLNAALRAGMGMGSYLVNNWTPAQA
ncbi:uncharacterized protein I303_103021 [Kwoniella dejecticola CBS 10117]|uniref:BHLH domain-containing protein n=1 Tax=Kwoniella dejecticola CBS 10117 TaxID=1296121 RepID=A0A1A6AAE1_9TREE|nr:uncharacterized protein I303_03041 [Kwoniella dejecticola CBS 10117]OBR87019.1 hypothetical protein I303_03041 [Kwoniella dejecticola CBS 10117]